MRYCFAIVLLIVLGACNTPEKLICKTWKVEHVAFDDNTTTLTPEQRKNIGTQVKEAVFTIKKNGDYSVSLNETSTDGKWNFLADKKSFHTKTGPVEADLKIKKLNKTGLIFEGPVLMGNMMEFTCVPVTGKK